jgi:2-haloacid dehalogenase
VDFERFEAITFDCYGTLIDWERGILRALDALFEGSGVDAPADEERLELFARLEADAEHGEFRTYREVLADVAFGFAVEFGVEADRRRAAAFAASVAAWPPFSDSTLVLKALGARYRLAIVSNVDDDLFEGSATLLGVDFDEVVTAQQLRSYKPAAAHFHEVLRRLDLPTDRVLHVAQSLYHDVAPAKALGFTCVWVNRRTGKTGGGATRPAMAVPNLEVQDLAELAREMGLG